MKHVGDPDPKIRGLLRGMPILFILSENRPNP